VDSRKGRGKERKPGETRIETVRDEWRGRRKAGKIRKKSGERKGRKSKSGKEKSRVVKRKENVNK